MSRSVLTLSRNASRRYSKMPQTKRKRGRTWPEPVLLKIHELVLAQGDIPPRRILAALVAAFPDLPAVDIPSERTIYDIRAELRPAGGDDEPWTLISGDPEEAALALPVLREMNRSGSGGTLGWNVSKDLVRWIARVRTADPAIPLREAFFQALRYLQAERGISEPADADRYLVLELYRHKETFR
jgi:hypothetical protein